MSAYVYPIALAIISVFVAGLEWAFPKREEQKQLRRGLGWDVVHLVFNGHFLGVILFGIATRWLLPPLDGWLAAHGWTDAIYRNAASGWPFWAQILVALFAVDFLQWCVHNLLHRVPWLWETHKCHHSVEDGEMDWIVSFRFQWTEVVVYRMVLYLPLAWFGFATEAVLFHAIFGTLIGHLNHANLDLSWGPLRYLFNSPNMHIWHHDYEGDSKTTKNFGIIFSCWDWIFGTAYLPDEPPKKLGFPGVERFPKNFFVASAWPLTRVIPSKAQVAAGTVLGVAILGAGYLLAMPKEHTSSSSATTPMLGESLASSQPDGPGEPMDGYAPDEAAATAALDRFGEDAREAGFAHPEVMVSVPELAAALGAPRLVLLDVRPEERFVLGHIPSARQLYRGDYSESDPIPGMSRPAHELQALLRRLGVNEDSVVVATTDGGPEAYRLWWTLRTIGYDIRVLDGGMQQWVARGHRLAEGRSAAPAVGDVTLDGEVDRLAHWSEVESFVERTGALLLDTREADEFSGEVVKPSAARGGRIPGAKHMEWWQIVRDVDVDHRMRTPTELSAVLERVGVTTETPVVTYCQSGTRSAGVTFALLQLGADEAQVANYDGSWAEYSRLERP
ncbi:MAG: sterol desaturase family protein [Deltaproteobacteria bacterium]|nr:sterol desaturase family protein [Deltaproteobacteria bacterium]